MKFENQDLTVPQKIKNFAIDVLDTVCPAVTGNCTSETPCNLIFLDIPAGYSERKFGLARLGVPNLTWLPLVEIIAVFAGVIVFLIVAAS